MLRALIFGVISIGLFSGCTSKEPTLNSFYMYKDAPIKHSQKRKDVISCQALAAKEVPASNQSSTTPTFTIPKYTSPVYCTTGYLGMTTCTGGQTTGGQTIGGNLVTSDANINLRNRFTDECLRNKGYIFTSYPIPQCRNQQIPGSYYDKNYDPIIFEPIKGSCVINNHNGGGSVVLLPKEQLSPNN
ncbi:hypothetical protein N9296_01220 [Amylibacter sp.]|nr:hypothetical protein [Amylibacter sp.]